MASLFRALARFGPSSFIVRSLNGARELHAVAAGTTQFKNQSSVAGRADYTLRRNTHRLEKGLIGRPRRPLFAVDYIEETVNHFVAAVEDLEPGAELDTSLAWSRDVLVEYFDCVQASPAVDRARGRFKAMASADNPAESLRLTPYLRDPSARPPVNYDALLELSMRRRSVRWFVDRKVPRSMIDAAISVAAQSPSACNRQPFEFLVFDDPVRVHRVASIPGGAAGYVEGLPALAVVVGRLDAFFSDRDRHLIYIDGSLAVMSFMLALETLGLSSCAINTPGVEEMEEALASELGLESYQRPVMLIAIGYPDPTGLVPRSAKKGLDDLRCYNP